MISSRNGNGKRHASQQSFNGAVKSICAIRKAKGSPKGQSWNCDSFHVSFNRTDPTASAFLSVSPASVRAFEASG
jgi:hypothetical protein